jgi:glycosyltransferase involved in cell wall biosynthesis
MRVAHVLASSKRRGAEIFASDLMTALSQSGVEQYVIVLNGTDGWDGLYPVPTVTLTENQDHGHGFRYHYRLTRLLRQELHRCRPDVVQAHGGDALKYSVLAALGHCTPILYRNIGMAAPWATTGPRRLMYSWLMRRSKMVVALAEAVQRETIETFGLPAEHVITLPNAVDPDRTAPRTARAEVRKQLGIPQPARVMLSLAALTWEKDPMTHLEVASRIVSRDRNTWHLFAGDGPLRKDLEKVVQQRDLQDRVLLLGIRADVPELLSASDVLLFASRADGMEGMPTILIEAGMAGLPVVAYAVAGAPEVLVNDMTGILVPSGDIDELVKSAQRLLSNEPARRRMGDAAKALCQERFDVRSQAADYISLYERAAHA